MYRSISIKNFRGFRDFTIDSLERINLIAGMNNAGKTALLESIFLFSGPNNPGLTLVLNVIRGIEQSSVDAAELWGWLFSEGDMSRTIELRGTTEGGDGSSLRITAPIGARLVTDADGSAPTMRSGPSLSTAIAPSELLFDYTDESAVNWRSRAFINPDGLKIESSQYRPTSNCIFLSARAATPQGEIQRYSKLEAMGRQDEVLSLLRILEPRLKRLAVLVTGPLPLIGGDIGVGPLVPLPYMGQGMVRLFSLAVAVASVPQGTVLVDEIENGLHHTALEKVWEAVGQAARQQEVQLFATTHSWECIGAAHRAFANQGAHNFRFQRLELDRDGDVHAVRFDEETLGTALRAEFEVR